MKLYPYKDKKPAIHTEAYISDGVYLTGDVRVGRKASIWFGTVARGDINHIEIGEESNIQDGSILHVAIPNNVVYCSGFFNNSVGVSVDTRHILVCCVSSILFSALITNSGRKPPECVPINFGS